MQTWCQAARGALSLRAGLSEKVKSLRDWTHTGQDSVWGHQRSIGLVFAMLTPRHHASIHDFPWQSARPAYLDVNAFDRNHDDHPCMVRTDCASLLRACSAYPLLYGAA
jgi:hypothetical protein